MSNRITTRATDIYANQPESPAVHVQQPDRPFHDPSEKVLNLKHADTAAFPPPDWALEEFISAASSDFEPYTPFRGDPAVLADVAVNVERFLGVPIDPTENVVLAAGSQGGLFAALAALAERGKPVALLDPDYMSTARVLRFLGAVPAYVPLSRSGGEDQVDLEALENAFINGARLFIFSNPNNPTGILLSDTTLRSIAALVVKYDAFVIVDELYSRLTYDQSPYVHLASLPGMQERCVTALGPSKAESMTGYRLGCMIVPSQLSNAIEDVVGITSMRAPSYAQALLRRWLRDDEELMVQRRSEYQSLRDTTTRAISQLPFATAAKPGGSSYIFVDVSELGLPDDYVAQFLLDFAGVAVNPGYAFGPSGRGSFRMCFAQDPSKWELRLNQMCEALSYLHRNKPE